MQLASIRCTRIVLLGAVYLERFVMQRKMCPHGWQLLLSSPAWICLRRICTETQFLGASVVVSEKRLSRPEAKLKQASTHTRPLHPTNLFFCPSGHSNKMTSVPSPRQTRDKDVSLSGFREKREKTLWATLCFKKKLTC